MKKIKSIFIDDTFLRRNSHSVITLVDGTRFETDSSVAIDFLERYAKENGYYSVKQILNDSNITYSGKNKEKFYKNALKQLERERDVNINLEKVNAMNNSEYKITYEFVRGNVSYSEEVKTDLNGAKNVVKDYTEKKNITDYNKLTKGSKKIVTGKGVNEFMNELNKNENNLEEVFDNSTEGRENSSVEIPVEVEEKKDDNVSDSNTKQYPSVVDYGENVFINDTINVDDIVRIVYYTFVDEYGKSRMQAVIFGKNGEVINTNKFTADAYANLYCVNNNTTMNELLDKDFIVTVTGDQLSNKNYWDIYKNPDKELDPEDISEIDKGLANETEKLKDEIKKENEEKENKNDETYEKEPETFANSEEPVEEEDSKKESKFKKRLVRFRVAVGAIIGAIAVTGVAVVHHISKKFNEANTRIESLEKDLQANNYDYTNMEKNINDISDKQDDMEKDLDKFEDDINDRLDDFEFTLKNGTKVTTNTRTVYVPRKSSNGVTPSKSNKAKNNSNSNNNNNNNNNGNKKPGKSKNGNGNKKPVIPATGPAISTSGSSISVSGSSIVIDNSKKPSKEKDGNKKPNSNNKKPSNNNNGGSSFVTGNDGSEKIGTGNNNNNNNNSNVVTGGGIDVVKPTDSNSTNNNNTTYNVNGLSLNNGVLDSNGNLNSYYKNIILGSKYDNNSLTKEQIADLIVNDMANQTVTDSSAKTYTYK